MVLNSMNLKKLVPGALAVGALFAASSAQAQSLTAPSTLTTPTSAVGVATATGLSGATVGSLDLALPTPGNSIIFQVSNPNLIAFTGLPATGNGTQGGLTLTLSLTTVSPAGGPFVLNFTGSSYSFNADATDQFAPFNAGTAVNVNPGGAQNFNLGGTTYTVTLASASSFSEGTPTSINISTITGTISAPSVGVAPEPGTLVLAGLGIAGLVARRRKH
jgi:PEP-CTERM motif